MVYRLVGRIVDVRGKCHAGHRVGEQINLTVFDEDKPVRGIDLCPFFMNNLFPYLCVLQFEGRFPWEPEPNVFVACCPDVENRVTIRIERVETGRGGVAP